MDPITGEHSIELTVLTYNVAGLPWPVQAGTGKAMRRIERAMAIQFAEDRPDFLLLQEAFVPKATALAANAGYTNWARGPVRGARTTLQVSAPADERRKGRKRLRGEGLGRIVNSGLVLGADHAIVSVTSEPFGRRSCGGFDCLANKGVMLAQVTIPGMPEPLFLLNTHLNSRGPAKVSETRSLGAHRQQVREIAALLARDWGGRGPLVYAGDFNARNSPDRFSFKDANLPGELAHRYCSSAGTSCRVEISWDSDEPWMDTQDLQGYADGSRVRIEPVRIVARFDEPVNGRMLSDHDGLQVTYRLRWKPLAKE